MHFALTAAQHAHSLSCSLLRLESQAVNCIAAAGSVGAKPSSQMLCCSALPASVTTQAAAARHAQRLSSRAAAAMSPTAAAAAVAAAGGGPPPAVYCYSGPGAGTRSVLSTLHSLREALVPAVKASGRVGWQQRLWQRAGVQSLSNGRPASLCRTSMLRPNKPASRLPQVASLDTAELLAGGWQDGCLLLVMPGGADLPYCKHLNGRGNALIRGECGYAVCLCGKTRRQEKSQMCMTKSLLANGIVLGLHEYAFAHVRVCLRQVCGRQGRCCVYCCVLLGVAAQPCCPTKSHCRVCGVRGCIPWPLRRRLLCLRSSGV